MGKVILCLGGNPYRNETAADLAKRNPLAWILVSSEGSPGMVADIYKQAWIPWYRVFYDFKAWDTLTNFTLTLPWILRRGCTELVVVTDQFHMRRALAIAWIVYAFHGVKITAQQHPSIHADEPDQLVRWDTWRALVWRLTGRTIENNDRQQRMQGIDAQKCEAIKLELQVLP